MKQTDKFKIITFLLCGATSMEVFAQQRNISGIILSAEDHEPLIGATISVKGK